jgi:hypothetical protein
MPFHDSHHPVIPRIIKEAILRQTVEVMQSLLEVRSSIIWPLSMSRRHLVTDCNLKGNMSPQLQGPATIPVLLGTCGLSITIVINKESLKFTLELNYSRSVQISLLLKGNVRISKRLSMQMSIVSNLLFVQGESGVLKDPKGYVSSNHSIGSLLPMRYQLVQGIGNM